MFNNFIKRIFRPLQHNIRTRRIEPEDPRHCSHNLPPGITPIESTYNKQPIPGTTRSIGTIEKILQHMDELINFNQKIGVRCGCGHHIFNIEEIITQHGVQRGLGGQCPYCALEAAELLSQKLISLQQAEEMSLYCSKCASHCDGCRRNNICIRHTQQFENLDGSILVLCPDCLKNAEQDKFFKKTLDLMLAPFVDYNRLPPPTQRRDPYVY